METGQGHPGETSHPMDTGFEGNRYAELAEIGESLETKSVNPLVMAVTGEWLSGHDRPHMFLTHPPVEDKLEYLESVGDEIAQKMGTEVPPRMLKTVTLRVGSGESAHRVLVGSVGRRIDNGVKRDIAADLRASFGLDITPKEAKGAAINPSDGWDTADTLKLEPGVVGPLLEDVVADEVLAYYFLEEAIDPESPTVPVELALSPEDSLIVRYQDLEEMLSGAQEAFVRAPGFFRTIPEPQP